MIPKIRVDNQRGDKVRRNDAEVTDARDRTDRHPMEQPVKCVAPAKQTAFHPFCSGCEHHRRAPVCHTNVHKPLDVAGRVLPVAVHNDREISFPFRMDFYEPDRDRALMAKIFSQAQECRAPEVWWKLPCGQRIRHLRR